MDPIEAAITAIEALSPRESFTYKSIAEKYGVNRITLARRHRHSQVSHAAKAVNQRKLNPQQELELVRYIKGLTGKRLPPTRAMIRNFASIIAKTPVSDSWVSRFLTRHSSQLTSRWNTAMDANRHQADSAEKYRQYFDLLHEKITQYDIEPRHTYNMDEKGFLIGVIGRSKRVFSREMWERKEVRAALQDGSREWITLLACVCADGSALPPGIIYKAADDGIQSNWVEDIRAGETTAHVTSSPTGWTNDDIGLAWLEQVFDRYTKKKARQSYRLLIVDGHGSHLTMDFINYCERNRIILAVLPPHSTHTLQPLDVVMFKSLSSAYSCELTEHTQKSQGLLPIKKGDFFSLFWKAWVNTFTEKPILKSFEATGIWPMDPEVILKKFTKTTTTDQESRESSISLLSESDWRKMRQLVNAAVKDRSTKEAKKLTRQIHHLQVQNELLNYENRGLREALSAKKKQHRQSKSLHLQQRKGYHIRAVIWSPRKIREAQTRQVVKEREEKEKQRQKNERLEQRRLKKETKELEKCERRERREAAKVVREKERVFLAAERERKKQEKGSQKTRQPSRKRNMKASRSSQRDIKRQKRVVEPVGSEELSGIASTAPPVTTRHGRNIKLPSRYN